MTVSVARVLVLGLGVAPPTRSPQSLPPVDEAWQAGGDLLDVIRATGNRDGWTDDEIRQAQEKVTAVSSRKKPPRWPNNYSKRLLSGWTLLPCRLPSPVAEARMPLWARDLLLAWVSRIPHAVLLAGPGPARVCAGPLGRVRPLTFRTDRAA